MSETNETFTVHDYARPHVYLVGPYYFLMIRYSTGTNKHIMSHSTLLYLRLSITIPF